MENNHFELVTIGNLYSYKYNIIQNTFIFSCKNADIKLKAKYNLCQVEKLKPIHQDLYVLEIFFSFMVLLVFLIYFNSF